MKYKPMGRSGVSVSELCFGTMSFGGDADEATSAALYKATRDAGINFYDCADQYQKGKSEQILGRLIQGHRDDVVITTKCFNPVSEDVNDRGNSRRHVTRAVEAPRVSFRTFHSAAAGGAARERGRGPRCKRGCVPGRICLGARASKIRQKMTERSK